MPNEAWTVGRIALLRRLWAEGETAAAIAARLGGMSRSAVLGKVYRLRLGADGGAAAAAAKARTGEAGASLARRRKGGKRKHQRQVPPAASRRGKTLLELTNETCRWIVEVVVKAAVTWAWSHFH